MAPQRISDETHQTASCTGEIAFCSNSDSNGHLLNPPQDTHPPSHPFFSHPSPTSHPTFGFNPLAGQTGPGISTVESTIQTQPTQSAVPQTETTSQAVTFGNTVNSAGALPPSKDSDTIVPSETQSRPPSTTAQVLHSMATTDTSGHKSSTVSVNSAPSAVASQRPATTNEITAKKHVNAGVLAGAVVGAFIAFLLAGVLLFYVSRRRFRNSKTEPATGDVRSHPLPGRWSVISGESDSATFVSNTIYQQPETLDQKLSTYPQSVPKDSEGYGHGYGYGFGISDPQKGLGL